MKSKRCNSVDGGVGRCACGDVILVESVLGGDLESAVGNATTLLRGDTHGGAHASALNDDAAWGGACGNDEVVTESFGDGEGEVCVGGRLDVEWDVAGCSA